MNDTASKQIILVPTIRWVARIMVILFIAFFLFLFISDSIEKGTISIENGRVPMTVFLFFTFSGLIIAWKWEGIGGAIAIVGLLGFNVLAPQSVPRTAILITTVLYVLPALLFLFCWWQTRK
jgi:hypothetical protein